MTKHTDAKNETVQLAIDNAFPRREIDDVDLGGISWNDLNETRRIDFTDGETVYLKVAVDGDGSRTAREVAVIGYVGTHCDVDVPSVIDSQTDRDPPYFVTAPMDGQNLADNWQERCLRERMDIIRQIGTALAEIHSCSFDCHGHIVGGGADDLLLETGPLTDIILDIIESIRDRASTDRFEHHFDEVSVAVKENRDRLDEAPATLIHCDPAHPNLFRNNSTIGFIDWEMAHIGDPARDLNRAEKQLIFNDTDQMVSAFHDGYRQRAGSLPKGFEDRAPIYDVIWHLNTSAFFDKNVGSIEKIEEAKKSHEEKMNRLLNKIR